MDWCPRFLEESWQDFRFASRLPARDRSLAFVLIGAHHEST
jgi:hypothetical protein